MCVHYRVEDHTAVSQEPALLSLSLLLLHGTLVPAKVANWRTSTKKTLNPASTSVIEKCARKIINSVNKNEV